MLIGLAVFFESYDVRLLPSPAGRRKVARRCPMPFKLLLQGGLCYFKMVCGQIHTHLLIYILDLPRKSAR
jgi:hypothetical protein